MRLPLTRPLLGTWPAIQACALTGNRTSDPSVLRLALNPLSHTSQGFWFHFILSKCVDVKPLDKAPMSSRSHRPR